MHGLADDEHEQPHGQGERREENRDDLRYQGYGRANESHVGAFLFAPVASGICPTALPGELVLLVGLLGHELRIAPNPATTQAGVLVQEEDESRTLWGGQLAVGHGDFWQETCKPDCATGPVVTTPIKITLSNRTLCEGVMAYLGWTIEGIKNSVLKSYASEYAPEGAILAATSQTRQNSSCYG